jgi:hypothetical protein
MTAINGTQVVDGHVCETAVVFPFDSDWAVRLAKGLEEL